ncbi:RNA polymerase sigma factor SigJ [Amycolatopsis sp. NPDC051903]|uniref:RNA polymerase sigma factor SigJ n=1 Tax=Amycolatopsis sp. NPDC051903 TaxID=3363936 RepID=UPI00378EDD79
MDETASATLDDAAEVFAQVRPRLFGIAYRMLGSAADAEDVLQEVWLRWQKADRSVVENPAAYLATTTTRLAINATRTAYARRETYLGPWLPEPIDTSADPQLGAERAAALEVAVLLLLEKLTPTERAAYVLREAFDYPYAQIAEIIQTSEVTARQYVSRARKHLSAERRKPVSEDEQRKLMSAFLAAAQAGDLSTLEKLFAEDVVSYSDSNGLARAARRPIHGAVQLAKVIRAYKDHFWTDAEIIQTPVNGSIAAVLKRAGDVYGVISFTVSDEGIDQVLWMLNPTKLSAAVPGA